MSDELSDSAGTVMAAIGAVTAVTGLAATYYLTQSPQPNILPPFDLNNQSVVLPDGSRCSRMIPDGKLISRLDKDVTTMYEIFQRGLSISENDPCLGQRTGPNLEYEWLTYRQVYDQVLAFGSWVLDHGYKSGKEQILGIFSTNRYEWVISEQACSAFSIVCTALYETLGQDSTEFVIHQTEMSLIVCDKGEKANKLLQMGDRVKSLRTIVVMDGTDGIDMTTAAKRNVKVISFKDALAEGSANLKKPVPPKPEDVSLICYTSGTTGTPKGVVLTHANMVADLAALIMTVETARKYSKNDVYLSYLPLPHLYERIAQQILFYFGSRIGFFRGDVKLLLEDAQALRPTFFAGVPRLLNKLYDKIMLGVQKSPLKKKLMEWGIAAKRREIKRYIVRRNGFWDKLMFHKIQAVLGGRVELITTGSAPLGEKVLDFLRCAFGCIIMEAYGQTECCAAATITVAGTSDSGHVGPPAVCNYVKLADCEEEGYLAKDNKGEVCVKGPTLFVGYYKEPAKTAEVLDKDGWLHTGDVGQWLPNGTLKIIDRKKHIFKLSQGEYVAPEKIEILLGRSLFVAQAFVDGDSLQPTIMAVVVPDEEMLMTWAKEQNLNSSFKEMCASENVKNLILSDVTRIGREAGLSGIEMVKDIVLHSELFSVENELLTPTFKNKRPSLRKYFKEDFAAMYRKQQS